MVLQTFYHMYVVSRILLQADDIFRKKLNLKKLGKLFCISNA